MPKQTLKDPAERVGRVVPQLGELVAAPVACWQGEVPEPPFGMAPPTLDAWATWFASWFSAFWTPADLPGLRQMAKLYDVVDRGEKGSLSVAGELRLWLDSYGVTPKGQQDRRWKPPAVAGTANDTSTAAGLYARLRSV